MANFKFRFMPNAFNAKVRLLEFPIDIYFPGEEDGDCFVTLTDDRQIQEMKSLFGIKECPLEEFPDQPFSKHWNTDYKLLRVRRQFPVVELSDLPEPAEGPSVW